MQKLAIGDVVWGKRFPTSTGVDKPHPALVVSIDEDVGTQPRVYVVLGSTKKVSESGHLVTEFVIMDGDREALAKAGLRESTRFDLASMRFMLAEAMGAERTGTVLATKAIRRRVEAAVTGYLRARKAR